MNNAAEQHFDQQQDEERLEEDQKQQSDEDIKEEEHYNDDEEEEEEEEENVDVEITSFVPPSLEDLDKNIDYSTYDFTVEQTSVIPIIDQTPIQYSPEKAFKKIKVILPTITYQRLEKDTEPTRLLCRLRLIKTMVRNFGSEVAKVDCIRIPPKIAISCFSLFLEVVTRGGYNRVTKERKWQEIAQALNCSTPTNIGLIFKGKYENLGLINAELDLNLIQESFDYGSHEAGARQASLPARAMTPIEVNIFPEYYNDLIGREKYLDCRDHILQRWCLNAERSIDFNKDILQPLLIEFDSEIIHEYPLKQTFFVMETLGYFNWGCLKQDGLNNNNTEFIGGSPKKIAIIGAGLSGLVCALQLSRFGHNVEIIEGRNRVGGRVHTDCKSFSSPVDLGAMLITGVQGHPGSILIHQLEQKKYIVGDLCPIYSFGEVLNLEVDKRVEEKFNSMLNSAAILSRNEQVLVKNNDSRNKIETRKRGRIIKKEQQQQQPKNNSFLFTSNDDEEICSKYCGVTFSSKSKNWKFYFTKVSTGEKIWDFSKDYKTELQAAFFHDEILTIQKDSNVYSDFFNKNKFPNDFLNCNFCEEEEEEEEGNILIHKKDENNVEKSKLFGMECTLLAENEIKNLKQTNNNNITTTTTTFKNKNPPIKDDYSLMERMLEEEGKSAVPDSTRLEDVFLSWHFANLEYACATSLARISGANWDQDDEYDWEGSHVMLPNGLGVLTEGMKRYFLLQNNGGGNEIKFQKNIKKIQINNNSPSSLFTEENEELGGYDLIVCTVSLGVLKEGLLEFNPPLPDWKLGAIKRLGFGNLNKVIFEFDSVFWNENHDIFGRVVHPNIGSRGEFYMFWGLNRLNPSSPIILALCAGDAAEEQEYRDDETIIKRCLSALQETFPNLKIPKPKSSQAVVTRWRSDPFTRGSYSFVGVGSSGEDYSLLAQEVFDNKLFFAGEATCKEHPATTGGALVSGLREAAKICSKYGRLVNKDQNDSSLLLLLQKIDNSISLNPQKLSNWHKVKFENIIEKFQSKISTSRDSDFFHTNKLETQNWIHNEFPSEDFLKSNREAGLKFSELYPRLSNMDEKMKVCYIAQRIGTKELNYGEEIGFWV